MTIILGLDFETYGAVNLPKHGLDRYVNDPSFRPLIAAVHGNYIPTKVVFDFIQDPDCIPEFLEEVSGADLIVAHNAGFEQAVLRHMGLNLPAKRFIDSAVVARAAGAGSRLEAAAPQLLNTPKMEEGRNLIKLFSIPGKLQEANGSDEFDPDIIKLHPQEWEQFQDYCQVDARLGYQIEADWGHMVSGAEHVNWSITQDMNNTGWHVDLKLVHEMKERYIRNTEQALAEFRRVYDPEGKLNFNSYPQLKSWCHDRGVKTKSFDEKHVLKYIKLIQDRLAKGGLTPDKGDDLRAVLDLLYTKRELGGSSLRKLDTIIAMTGHDGRLRNQYLHIGAGQTWRTSGRGVQMQNLKRLSVVADVDAMVDDDDDSWSNTELATQLRQVFSAEHPDGELIVGDFSSIESRGLAYEAGEKWKVDSYHRNLDMYKVLAAKIDGVPYEEVTKDRRQFGKVGELSCGYGAGGGAVQAFAENMGTILTEGQAKQLVNDWRDTNPMVLKLWDLLDFHLKEVVEKGRDSSQVGIGYGMVVMFKQDTTPVSLHKQHPGAQSVSMHLFDRTGGRVMRRILHGCYMRNNNVGYYKPSPNKTGDLWKNHYIHPKTGEVIFYTVYGGKLAGLLTQSWCRELFFHSLRMLENVMRGVTNVKIVGQFHDEIVLEWWPDKGPSSWTLDRAMNELGWAMSHRGAFSDFPLAADIKHDHRYTK